MKQKEIIIQPKDNSEHILILTLLKKLGVSFSEINEYDDTNLAFKLKDCKQNKMRTIMQEWNRF